MKNYYIETYGCTLNKTDTALIIDKLDSIGFKRVDSLNDADIIIINTCTVRLDTEEKLLRRIKELCGNAEKLIVTGCLASAQPSFVLSSCRDAIVIDNELISFIHLYLNDSMGKISKMEAISEKANNPSIHREGPIFSVPLVDGCLDNCSYCLTKLARPSLLSRNPEKLIAKIKSSVVSSPYDVIEVQLTGQDLAVYGYDIAKKPLLPKFLEELLSLDYGGKLIKVRLGMMTPNWFKIIKDDILSLMRSDDRIYRFLHLPVQSGDDRLLKVMKRSYSVSEYKAMIKEVKSKVNDIQIATDIIVGHPGEDELAFLNTLKLLEELKVERIHIAQYTPRPHTLSARMSQIPHGEKKRRSLLVNEVYMRIGYEWHSKLIGKRVKVYLVERFRWKNGVSVVGRTDNYVSVVVRDASEELLGRQAFACIEEATFFDVRGRLC